ncbi:hypothetical protein IHE45_18G084000 [Dioscorea alata]|uniref:Uncharacterized protein n=1 Tax=Dioscorea alata TaxID=55571 RepID=A0ACB7U8E3_DIOAL|nr:hypothetical protein IHE45_18G084000 [Dioscorea alata]
MGPQPCSLDDKEKMISDEREEESFEELNEEVDEELMQFGDEIKPVEHLVEPLDEDGPIKCPVLDSFPLLDQSMWKEVITDGLQKRKDPFAEREHVTQSSSKRRHHSPSSPSSSKSPHTNLFQVFNQCRHYSF